MRASCLTILALLILLLSAPSARPVAAAEESAGIDIDRVNALGEREKDRLRQLGSLAVDSPEGKPFRRVDGNLGFASIILPEREQPYTIPELAGQFPKSFEVQPNGVYLVKDDLVVGEGGTLLIASADLRELRLVSGADRFVTITSWRGTVTIAGTRADRVRIVSWDPELGAPDTELNDGRAWVHTRRGSMSIDWATLEYLGFVTGSLSGVAWEGRPDDPSRGNVTGSIFQYNYFGAYTFEAIEMQWRMNTFAYNIGYGFDPHDHSDYFLVEYNRAYGNGTHGIIFSRGCKFNIIRYNASFDNGMHGIVLDDGPNLNPDGTLRERQGIPSDDNVVTNNVVAGNVVGIVLDGGTRNTVTNNSVVGNEIGIRMKDAVSNNTISGNRIVDSVDQGIYLYNGSNANAIADNVLRGGASGMQVRESTGNRIERNVLTGMGVSGIAFVGDVSGTLITGNLISGADRALDITRATDTSNMIRLDNTIAGETRSEDTTSFAGPLRRWVIWGGILLVPVLLGPWFGRFRTGLRTARLSLTRAK